MKATLGTFVAALVLVCISFARADDKDGRLDIYFIDVEGGASTLFVTPAGESLLIDSGFPENNGRDLNRVLDVVRNVAKLDHVDHAQVTHWHIDHYGNHAALAAQIPIRNFWDRGIPDALREDRTFVDRIAAYRAASQNQSRTLHAGDTLPLKSASTPLKATILTASREVVPNTGEPNPFAAENEPKPVDTSDNSASLTTLIEFGKFRFLCCGDLSWNVEAQLVTPNNAIGKIDLFMVTHHGMAISNNPVLVKAIDPVTAVMCNGPRKGGEARSIATVRDGKSLKDLYQLHRAVALSEADQVPAEFMANPGGVDGCQGVWVKASVTADGNSYTIQIGPDGMRRTYACRGAGG